MSSTPLQGASYPAPVYADPAATMSGGTPLILSVSRTGREREYHVLVRLQLLQAYERAIFELQQQLAHYKVLLEEMLPRTEEHDYLRLEATPLNAASVRLLNSILACRVAANAFRGQDDSDEM